MSRASIRRRSDEHAVEPVACLRVRLIDATISTDGEPGEATQLMVATAALEAVFYFYAAGSLIAQRSEGATATLVGCAAAESNECARCAPAIARLSAASNVIRPARAARVERTRCPRGDQST